MPHFFSIHLVQYISFLRRHNALPELLFHYNTPFRNIIARSASPAMSCDPAFNAFHSKGPQYSRSRLRGIERAGHGRGRHSCFSKRRLSTGRASELHIHPYPIQTIDEIKARHSDLLSTAKLQWLDNPKNVIFSYKHSRFGSYPESVTLEGRYPDGNKPVFRSTIAIDDDLGIVATGDGTSRKEAEKAAALHGMIPVSYTHLTLPTKRIV